MNYGPVVLRWRHLGGVEGVGDGWAGAVGEKERFLCIGRRENQGSLFVLARRCRPLADRVSEVLQRAIFKIPPFFRATAPPQWQRNPHHVLRTAARQGILLKGLAATVGVAGASVRHQRSGKGALWGGGGARNSHTDGHGQTRTNTDGHGRWEVEGLRLKVAG